ncbi:MAG: ATP-binding protein [Simkaniaceae bacterium]|nr:ATP-binding protein [Candidatus Sacchlamyda saccharinae]
MSSKSFPATISQLPAILTWVRSHLDQTALAKPEKMRLELALEEAIVNVIHHGKVEELSLGVRQNEGQQIEFELIDPGPAFNPLTHIQADNADLPLEEQVPGGKGLILMRKCADALLYRRDDDLNVLTVVKKL